MGTRRIGILDAVLVVAKPGGEPPAVRDDERQNLGHRPRAVVRAHELLAAGVDVRRVELERGEALALPHGHLHEDVGVRRLQIDVRVELSTERPSQLLLQTLIAALLRVVATLAVVQVVDIVNDPLHP